MTPDMHSNDVKQLRRSSTDKMLAGVCGGWARYLGMDAALLRILLVAVTLFGVGAPIVIYLACWLLMPQDE
ncbi:PspC domain-containing protein [Haloechinothrix salitolerans]|uniref:PspC domain-containing protein n=1 Tax=Haloechinothrix salitolerans TaxID=926830 RepID=A0ABW2BW94_9PSEU